MTAVPGRDVVVVDGSNLATEGRTTPSLRQLDEAVRAYAEEDPSAEIVVVVDASFEHRVDPSERQQLIDAELHGEVVSPPAGAIGRGDAFVLRIAERTGARVLSNDSFQEFHGEHPWLFDEGRLIGGKPVPGIGWIFTPRVPVRGPKSRQATGKAKRKESQGLSAPVKAAELAKAAKKLAARKAPPALLADGTKPKVGDVWPAGGASDGHADVRAQKKPKEKTAAKKSAATKVVGACEAGLDKEAAAKKAAATEAAARKRASTKKESVAKKEGEETPAEKAGVESTPAKEGVARKRPTAKRPTAKRPTAKKAPADKLPAKEATGTVAEKVAPTKAAAPKKAAPAKAAPAKAAAPKKAVPTKPAPAKAAAPKKAAPAKVTAPKKAAAKAAAPKTAPPAKAVPKRATAKKVTAKKAVVPATGAVPHPAPRDGTAVAESARATAANDPAVQEAIGQALAEVTAPVVEAPGNGRKQRGAEKRGKQDGKGGRHRRRRPAAPLPAVNEPLAFITFVATYPLDSELEGEVVSFTSHGAMVDVDLPDGGVLHSYIPLAAMGDPPPTKARQVLKRGERRTFILVALDPPRRVAELALPEFVAAHSSSAV